MRYWKLKNSLSVESHGDHVVLDYADEILEDDFNHFISNLPVLPSRGLTDTEKLVKWAKKEGHI